MIKFLRTIHLLGLVMFLGSIISYIIINEMAGKSNNLEIISFVKSYVYFGSKTITVPGMWLLVMSGIIMSYRGGYSIKDTNWLKTKFIVAILIILNATFLIMPATRELAHRANDSLIKGVLNSDMDKFQMREDMFGTINVIGIFANIILVIYFNRSTHEPLVRK